MQSRSGREGGSLRVSGEPQVGGLQGHRRIDEHFAHAGQDVFNGFKVQADVRDSRLVGVRSLLRAEASLNAPPARVLGRVNHLLLEMNARGLFVTILYGILKRTTGEFDYVRAGHELPLVWDRRGEIVPTEKTAGQPLGLFNQPVLEPQRLTMPKGGTLLLFTDGVTEACSPQGDFFDDTGLESAAQALLSLPAQALCDALMRSLEDFQGEGSQDDDITVMAVKSIA